MSGSVSFKINACFISDTDQYTRSWRRPPQVLKIKGKTCLNTQQLVLYMHYYFLVGLIHFFIAIYYFYLLLLEKICILYNIAVVFFNSSYSILFIISSTMLFIFHSSILLLYISNYLICAYF